MKKEEVKTEAEKKPPRHRHEWWLSRKIDRVSHIQRCNCGAKRIVISVNAGLTIYRYPNGREIRVQK